jgi:hypothetical protein
MTPFDAAMIGRLLVGHALNGELRGMTEPFRSMAEHLAAVAADGVPDGPARREALAAARGPLWGAMLAARPDRDELVKAVAAVNPEGPAPEARADDGDGAGLVTTCLADIRPEPIRWHVPGYLPLGKLIILAGEGGYGKSTLTLDLTAGTSRGRCCFGLAYGPPGPADVLLVSCEDDYGDTVVPRLLSAGADLSRVHRVDGVAVGEGRPLAFTLAHLDRLEAELVRRRSVRLVIIDPVSGFVGRAGVDDNRDAELRTVLDPLAELAARRSALVLMVKHLSKDQTRRAAQRVGGSAAYVNAARAAFVVAPDPGDRDRRLFLPIKFNCGPWPSGLAFRMDALPAGERAGILAGMDHLGPDDRDRLAGQLYRVGWQGPVSVTADDALGADARAHRAAGKADPDRAAGWLRDRLAAGPAGSALCASEGDRALGRPWPPPGDDPGKAVNVRLKWWRESVLKARLGGRPRKLGMDGPWFFALPDGAWPPSPEAVTAARLAESDGAPEASEESEESEAAGPDSSGAPPKRPPKNPPVPRPPARDSSASSPSSKGERSEGGGGSWR